jgi:hypothetical protein
VRLRDAVGLLLILQELWRAMANITVHVARRKGPFGVGRLTGLLTGLCRSFELSVDNRHLVYNPPGGRTIARGLSARGR